MSGTTADNAGRQSGIVAEASAGIEILSSDPSAEHGKAWFNSTTSLLKYYLFSLIHFIQKIKMKDIGL